MSNPYTVAAELRAAKAQGVPLSVAQENQEACQRLLQTGILARLPAAPPTLEQDETYRQVRRDWHFHPNDTYRYNRMRIFELAHHAQQMGVAALGLTE